MKTATLLEGRGYDVAEMGVTRLMWTKCCIDEEDRRIMKRNAFSARLGQTTDEEYRKHIRG